MKTDDIIYELVEISTSIVYEQPDDTFACFVSEDNLTKGNDASAIETMIFDADGIPMGTTINEIKLRRQMIFQFYDRWKTEHPDKSVFNKNLNANILIRSESVIESAEHASKRYKSTLAVFMLDELLSNAVRVAEDSPKKGNKNQEKLVRMILMSYDSPYIGTIKLTVGVRRRSLDNIQYGISALEDGESIVPFTKKNSKKKASHKK